MASFAAQAAIRSKWSDLIESTPLEIPGEVTSGVRSVVGWLKQASLEVRQAGKRTFGALSGSMTQSEGNNIITILHYNDTYNIESRNVEPVGGAARFSTAMKSFNYLNPLILFSGDIFSPSMLSTVTKGEQMVAVLNELNTHCAVFGNHDFDFGLEILSQYVQQTTCPWLMSNVLDNETGRPLGDGKISHAINWQGQKIGFIGLVEKEWLDTLATVNPEQITFIDYIEAGEKLALQLKKEGCNYIIALTHMRTPNDINLAEKVNDIDLILGGHDHVYEVLKINNKHIVKSGTDFRQFSKISLDFGSPVPLVSVEEVNVSSSYKEDPIMVKLLEKYTGMFEGKLQEILGVFAVPLEGRFESIRTGETNLGNWVCDVVLAATNADCVILNSGTFRSDTVHAAGNFTLGDLVHVIPMMDPLVLLSVTGEQLLRALENGVSAYPKLEGRFPQVAGLSFAFDREKPPYSRIDRHLVRVGDEYLDLNSTYRLATKTYLYQGCDGYDVLRNGKLLMDEETTPELGLAIRNHFQAINMKLGKTGRHSKHRQSLVTLSRRHSLVRTLDAGDGPPVLRDSIGKASVSPSNKHMSNNRSNSSSVKTRLSRRASFDDLEQESCELTPRVEGRIVLLTDEKRKELLEQRKRFETDSVIPEIDAEDV
ncbi:hypothetical protein RUM43_012904 [Polyplax serrata]|uniref:Uncharacterized protein n=1 Tax=Polyplax serrata TaxID=468196 RepID=A0AAN8Q394_POLSC